MPNERHSASFSIDGYEVSATFADAGNLTAISHAKQILLSAFIASTSALPAPILPKLSVQFPAT